ncbi:hypothetical protein QAD02_005630 [Eretmocerus hayati]|uniref:Uncharacterized protein n=1 Tax=Eretmocerus hayati TaxID=131215 RepID=A0ACC2NU14_9HYME|nr:hypothetical protein QAD02_005630 [Eretmocerus hayati]
MDQYLNEELDIFHNQDCKLVTGVLFEGLDFDASNEPDDVFSLQYEILTRMIRSLNNYQDSVKMLLDDSVACKPLHVLLDILLKFKKNEPKISTVGISGMTEDQLFCAAVRVFDLLLEHGADPNCVNKRGKTALYRVSHHLKKYYRRRTAGPLFNSSQLQFKTIIDQLLLYGAELNEDCSKNDPFTIALESGDAESILSFIQHGYDLNKFNSKIPTPSASDLGFFIFELIARSDIFDLEARDCSNSTALHRAVTCVGTSYWPATWPLNEIKLLLELGANVNAIDKNGYSVLARATRAIKSVSYEMHVYEELVKLLLSYGARVFQDSNVPDQEPMVNVLTYGNWKSVKLLLRKCLDSGISKVQYGLYPLHRATTNNDTKVLEELLLTGLFDIEQKNEKGESPLHVAVTSNKTSSYVKILLEWGVNVNSKNNSGRTALHLLAGLCEGDQEVIKSIEYLLWNGAEINFKTIGNNKLPLEIAMRCWRPQTSESIVAQVALLEHQGLEVDPDNYSLIASRHSLNELFELCKAELELVQTSVVEGSITYYDFLVAKKACIGRCVGIESVQKSFEGCSLEERFPIYGRRIRKRFVKMRDERELFNRAGLSLSRLLGLDYDAFYAFYSSVMLYLTRRDLLNLRKLEIM